MFDDLLRELKRLEQGVSVPIGMPLDEGGYFDRRCPWDDCSFTFKVLFEDWKEKVSDDTCYCPSCGHKNLPQSFNTAEQDQYIKQVGLAYLQGRVLKSMRADAARFNRQPQRSFITMRLNVKDAPVPMAIPSEATEAMTLRVTCESCDCRFSVIGAAYFCPACGHSSANQILDQSLEATRRAVAALPTIRASLADRDTAALTSAKLLEGLLVSLVTAFQRFAEANYPGLPLPTQQPRRNAFQSLTEGSQLWSAAGGSAYSAILDASELADLSRFFQQRHLLAHREGLVDQDYIAKSADSSYAVGQRLVVREQSVMEFVRVLEKLVSGLRADL
jgi:hypothetical protein